MLSLLFHRLLYRGCDTVLLGEALHLPSELLGDRGSLWIMSSSGGWLLGTMGYGSNSIGSGDCM